MMATNKWRGCVQMSSGNSDAVFAFAQINNPNSYTFTRENPIDLPDLDSADMQEASQEEYCENCGRPMVLKRGRFGQFMACTGYPDCKTTRRLDQGKKVPDIPLE